MKKRNARIYIEPCLKEALDIEKVLNRKKSHSEVIRELLNKKKPIRKNDLFPKFTK